jgi:hypothetical protein
MINKFNFRKQSFINFIKVQSSNYVISGIFGGITGYILTISFIHFLHIQKWDSEHWNTFFNFFVALGTMIMSITAILAYKNYWKQKHIESACTILSELANFIQTDCREQITHLGLKCGKYGFDLSKYTPAQVIQYKSDLIQCIIKDFVKIEELNNRLFAHITQAEFAILLCKNEIQTQKWKTFSERIYLDFAFLNLYRGGLDLIYFRSDEVFKILGIDIESRYKGLDGIVIKTREQCSKLQQSIKNYINDISDIVTCLTKL